MTNQVLGPQIPRLNRFFNIKLPSLRSLRRSCFLKSQRRFEQPKITWLLWITADYMCSTTTVNAGGPRTDKQDNFLTSAPVNKKHSDILRERY